MYQQDILSSTSFPTLQAAVNGSRFGYSDSTGLRLVFEPLHARTADSSI